MEYATDFKEDLDIALEYENLVIKLLTETSNFTFIRKSDGDNKIERKEFDILMKKQNGNEASFEIKTDFKAHRTGNEIFEIECYGKNSGIMVTKADYFVTVYATMKKIIFYKTSSIKSLLENYLENKENSDYINAGFKIKPGGDNNTATLILINAIDMNQLCKDKGIERLCYTYKRDEKNKTVSFFKEY